MKKQSLLLLILALSIQSACAHPLSQDDIKDFPGNALVASDGQGGVYPLIPSGPQPRVRHWVPVNHPSLIDSGGGIIPCYSTSVISLGGGYSSIPQGEFCRWATPVMWQSFDQCLEIVPNPSGDGSYVLKDKKPPAELELIHALSFEQDFEDHLFEDHYGGEIVKDSPIVDSIDLAPTLELRPSIPLHQIENRYELSY